MAKYTFDPSRIPEAHIKDWRVLEFGRKQANDCIKEMAGYYYSDTAAKLKNPVNYIGMWTDIMVRTLISNNPRYIGKTFDRSAIRTVAMFQQWMNDECIRLRVSEVMQQVALDGFFFGGYVKVHLATPADAVNRNWGIEAGECCVSFISHGDIIYSTGSHDWRDLQYVGHRYRMPLELAEDLFKAKLTASRLQQYNPGGDERVSALERGEYANWESEIEDMVELWEYHIPRYGQVITLRGNDGGYPQMEGNGKPLQTKNYLGPDQGQIYQLGYGRVPGNLRPKAPALDLLPLHEANGRAWRKLVDAMDDVKENTIAQDATDAQRLTDAQHGHTVQMMNPAGVTAIMSGGKIMPILSAFIQSVENGVNQVGGNLSLLGGRSQQANTLGQEKILNSNGNAQVEGYQDQVTKAFQWIGDSMKWYGWYHPSKVMRTKYTVKGMPELWTARSLHPYNPYASNFHALLAGGATMRKGDMPEMQFDAVSVRAQSPTERAKILVDFVMQIYTPLAQLFMQSGQQIDTTFLLNKLGELWDCPDLPLMMQVMAPPTDPGGSGMGHDQGVSQPVVTQRNYNRTSTSEVDPQATGANAVAAMYGVDTGGANDAGGGNMGA